MIGYITKVSSFGALARYLQSGTDGSPKKRVLWTTARYVSGDLQKAAAEMNLSGHFTNTEALGYHLTIGFDPADRPTRPEMEYAVKRTLGALGLEENMAITAAHGDAYFAHTHTMIARWDYWTARLVEASNSYYVITRVMRELEDEFGMEPAPRPYWERAGQETELRNTEGGRAQSSPIRLIDQFPTAARNQARAALQTATSWGHLQELLRREDLRFVRGRDNLLISKGEVSVRAGQITGGTSLAKLEARFGQTLREHEADVAGRLIKPVGDAPRKANEREKTTRRSRKDEDTRRGKDTRRSGSGAGRKREGEQQAEDLLLALGKAFRRRKEAYQLTRRSALLEAEEVDVAGLQEDLKQIEMRGTTLLEDLLQAGGSSSRERLSNGASRGSELREGRRRKEEARELWRRATCTVERQESARSITPESLGDVLGEARLGKSSPEQERRLLALLSEHRLTAEQAAELFLPKATDARMSEEGNPWSTSETVAPDKESSMRRDSDSEGSHPEEILTGGQSRQDGAEVSGGPSATTLPAEALLKETREAIREARLGLEKRLRGWQRQVQGGEGVAELERRLRRVLGRLADRDREAASRFGRRYVLVPEKEREPGAEGGGESESAYEGGGLEGEGLQSPEVQEALRRALPEGVQLEGVQLEGQRGPERKSPSRSM
ncbi:MAG: relaxase/mobilization nuclease domain-containing protein [Candidatus Nitrospinota bacterium M3_3B_026]|jgi:hypothetical protein|uniref:relaxase/mobilization nuclease domain-containing protein n=1 Tax=Salinibacter ruber TaxID=146919 RepID=UPI00216A0EA2|nr:relaxase/mobilization nuclease domain-containing protein [Salinibacter ruber]MCS3751345.1 hypothetical protein [Salinibacter ruber]